MTRAEVILWSLLRRRALKVRFRRQHPIGSYVADFACLSEMLVVEVDGATHWTAAQQAHDAERSAFVAARGWRVLRLTNTDIYEDADAAWRLIEATLAEPG